MTVAAYTCGCSLHQLIHSLLHTTNSLRTPYSEQKEEMMGKLKELGNGILGKFGMSLDNFKVLQQVVSGYVVVRSGT